MRKLLFEFIFLLICKFSYLQDTKDEYEHGGLFNWFGKWSGAYQHDFIIINSQVFDNRYRNLYTWQDNNSYKYYYWMFSDGNYILPRLSNKRPLSLVFLRNNVLIAL